MLFHRSHKAALPLRWLPWLLVSLKLIGCLTPKDLEDALDPDNDGYDLDEDCDSTDDLVNPAAAERCDGIDNDCDGLVDEGAPDDSSLWYYDGDGDGHGDPSGSQAACEPPEGYVEAEDDCDDEQEAVYPGAPELCDGLDNDCDGLVDGEDALDAVGAFVDADGDGYGDPAAPIESCEKLEGTVYNDLDCDDAAGSINPAADDNRCDGVDDDCDGLLDDDALWVGPADDPEVAWDYTSIQSAVDHAGTGQCVCVTAGTYYENVTISGKDVCVVGVDGLDSTWVHGGTNGSVFRLVDVGPEGGLQGLSITKGAGSKGDDDVARGGGVYLQDSSAALTDLLVTQSWATYGGGVYVTGGHPVFQDVDIVQNTGEWGAGLSAVEASFDFTDGLIFGNVSAYSGYRGGGFYLFSSTDVKIANSEISNNSANEGGGVYIYDSEVNMTDLDIHDNSGQGLHVYLDRDVNLTRVNISENTASAGAGVRLISASPLFREVTISGNQASSDGGGVYTREGSPSFDGVTIINNRADRDGGGIYGFGGTITLTGSTILSNEATAGAGGGMYIAYGGAVYLKRTSVTSNLSLYGAAISAVDDGYGATVTASASLISCNDAETAYGGIWAKGANIKLSNVTLAGNSSDLCGGLCAEGDSNVTIENAIFAYNLAETSDGALSCLDSDTDVTVSYAAFYDNTPELTTSCEDPTSSPGVLVGIDPGFVSTTGDCADWDLHLDTGSAMIDVGTDDPGKVDPDGTRNDLGAYGGPDAE